MILSYARVEIEAVFGRDLTLIEQAGRTCYKSEDLISENSAIQFAKMLLKRGHESVIEHSAMTVRFIIDRGVSHELVRHRLCAFSQESTRYCNYKGGVEFIIPPWAKKIEPGEYNGAGLSERQEVMSTRAERIWFYALQDDERRYKELIKEGWRPEHARSVLPNSLKTEIVTTANFREWRHIFNLRVSPAAHPQMKLIMAELLRQAHASIPVIFDDIYQKYIIYGKF